MVNIMLTRRVFRFYLSFYVVKVLCNGPQTCFRKGNTIQTHYSKMAFCLVRNEDVDLRFERCWLNPCFLCNIIII